MKINEIIRKRRTDLGLTQEQVASYLGVSASAVNKWEKAGSYPDITLLPALARLLDTDLNTLLSFQQDLDAAQIGSFLNKLCDIAASKGIAPAFSLAMEKLHEYPTSGMLLLNTALTLEGMLSMYLTTDDEQIYMEKIEKLYERAADCPDMQISSQAKTMLISKYMNRCEFDRAERLLKDLPDENAFPLQKKHLQAQLYMHREQWEDAARLTEHRLLSHLNDIQSSLFLLMEIALKEGRTSDAAHITSVSSRMTELFDLWECTSYGIQFQLAFLNKDAPACLAAIRETLLSMRKPWQFSQSPLYCHIPQKEGSTNMKEMALPKILEELKNPDCHEYDFLREEPGFQDFLDSLLP